MLIYSYPSWMIVFILLGNLAGWYYSAPPVRLSQRGFGELCYTAHQFITGIDPNGVTIGQKVHNPRFEKDD